MKKMKYNEGRLAMRNKFHFFYHWKHYLFFHCAPDIASHRGAPDIATHRGAPEITSHRGAPDVATLAV